MEQGQLVLKADVGPLNFMSGFSIGSSGILTWRPDRDGRRGQITMRGTKRAAHRCAACGTTLFRI